VLAFSQTLFVFIHIRRMPHQRARMTCELITRLVDYGIFYMVPAISDALNTWRNVIEHSEKVCCAEGAKRIRAGIAFRNELLANFSCYLSYDWIIYEKLLIKIRFFLFLRIYLACFSLTLLFLLFQSIKSTLNRTFLTSFFISLQ